MDRPKTVGFFDASPDISGRDCLVVLFLLLGADYLPPGNYQHGAHVAQYAQTYNRRTPT